MSSNVPSGARIAFSLNGRKVAWATSVSYAITHEHLPVNTLDLLEPREYAETAYFVTFTAGGFRVPGNSVINSGNNFMPELSRILSQGELTATITDKVSGSTLLTVHRVKPIERSGSVGARDLFTESLNFVGITAGDEGCNQDPGTSAEYSPVEA